MSLKEWFKEKIEEFENDPEFILEGFLLEINEVILEFLKKRGLSKKEFAEELDVSPAYVTKLLNGKPNLTIKSLIKIASVLDLKLNLSFEEARNIYKLEIPIDFSSYKEKFPIKAREEEEVGALAA